MSGAQKQALASSPQLFRSAARRVDGRLGSASDLVYLHMPDWSADDDQIAERMKAELGHFTNAVVSHRKEEAYPNEG